MNDNVIRLSHLRKSYSELSQAEKAEIIRINRANRRPRKKNDPPVELDVDLSTTAMMIQSENLKP